MLKLRLISFVVPAVSLLGLSTGCYNAEMPPEAAQEAVADEHGPSATAEVREAPSCLTAEEADRMADQVVQLVNLERVAEGMPPVTTSDKLAKIAADYACEMIEEGFFGHRNPMTGHDQADRAVAGKYVYYVIGENLAVGQQTPAELMKEWMESPAHHDAILDPTWTEIGVAVRLGGEYSIYWVQLFGHPAEDF